MVFCEGENGEEKERGVKAHGGRKAGSGMDDGLHGRLDWRDARALNFLGRASEGGVRRGTGGMDGMWTS